MPLSILRIFACVFVFLCTELAQAATVKSVRVWRGADYTRLVLDLDSPVQHNLTLASNPTRIILDVTASTLKSPFAKPSLAGTPIEALRSSSINQKDLRLVLDLKQKVTAKSFLLKKSGDSDDRLVIDLFDAKDDALAETNNATGTGNTGNPAATASSPAAANTSKARPVTANELNEPVNIEDLIVTSEPTAKTDTQSTGAVKPAVDLGGKRAILITVDAGHGGEDTGALGPNGMREKDVTLAIARELVNAINAQPGYNARLTRSSDFFIPLQKRRNIARDMKADLFISIHADSFTNGAAKGASVFALSRKGATSEAARFLAQRENESDLIGGVGGISLDDKDAMLAGVLVDLSMTATVNSSLQVGSHVLNAVAGIAPLHSNHVEQAGFVVLKSPDVPSILVETGFISNKEEARKLASPAYRTQMAQSVFKGVNQYFMRNPPAGTFLAAQLHSNSEAIQGSVNTTVQSAALKNTASTKGAAGSVAKTGSSKKSTERQHKVVRGDTLADIASQYNVSLAQLRKYNGMTSSTVKIGQTIKIPAT